MLSVHSKSELNNSLLRCIDNSITDKQRVSINNRLKGEDVQLCSLYRHNKTNIIVLGCIIKPVNANRQTYFLYWDNGIEHAKGLNFINEYGKNYSLLVDLNEKTA